MMFIFLCFYPFKQYLFCIGLELKWTLKIIKFRLCTLTMKNSGPKKLSDLIYLVHPRAMIFPLYYYTTLCILIINASGGGAWCGESRKAFNLVFMELNIKFIWHSSYNSSYIHYWNFSFALEIINIWNM